MGPLALVLLGAVGAGVAIKAFSPAKKEGGGGAPVSPLVGPDHPGMVNALEKGRSYMVQANINAEELVKAVLANPNSPEAQMLKNNPEDDTKSVGTFLAMIFYGMGFQLTGGALGSGAVPVPLNENEKKKFFAGIDVAEARFKGDPNAKYIPIDMNSIWTFAGQWTKDDKYLDAAMLKKVPFVTGMTFTMLPVA
jgi:hypothetical protein